MLPFLLRRLIGSIPVMLIVALLIFSLLYIAPGDPAAIIAGDQATAEHIETVRISLGLDRPYLIRFGEWLWNAMQGNLGASVFTQIPVIELIGQRLEPTISLLAFSFLFAVAISIPMGILAAYMRGRFADRAVVFTAVLGFSVPVFVVGYILIYIFSIELKLLPVQGYKPLSGGVVPWIRSLVLPSMALGFAYAALIARMTRSSMLEVLSQDYIRTAKAKGLGQRSILFLHAFKNAAVPVVTVVGLGVAGLISGAVVTETVFSIPGVGRLTVDAILQRDYPVIQGVMLFSSMAYLLINLLVDLIYVLIDPRIRY